MGKRTEWSDVKAEWAKWKADNKRISEENRKKAVARTDAYVAEHPTKKPPTYKELREEQKRKEAEKRQRRMEKGYPSFIRFLTAGVAIVNVIIAIPIALTIVGIPISIAIIAINLWMWNKYVKPGGRLL